MEARHRTKDERLMVSGTYRNYVADILVPRTVYHGPEWVTDDTTGNRSGDNFFSTLHSQTFLPVLEGEIVNALGEITKKFENFPLDGNYPAQNPAYRFTDPDWLTLKAEIAAATNPSRPSVSLPTFLGELRDLPSMLQDIPLSLKKFAQKYLGKPKKGVGNLQSVLGLLKSLKGAPKTAANQNLSYWFGWRPFLGDLRKLVENTSAINQKLRYIKRLAQGKKIGRRVSFPTETIVIDEGERITHSLGTIVKHRGSSTFTSVSWATSRWRMSWSGVVPETDQEQLDLARRLAYGITSYEGLAAAWELIPWSWFADWFGGLGNFIAANNNSLPVSLESVCWMRTSSVMTTWVLTQPPAENVALVGPYFQKAVKKERQVLTPLPTLPFLPTVPVLTNRQWSILVSLLAQYSM